MAGQTVESDEANPGIEAIGGAARLAFEQIGFERADLAESGGMIKGQKVIGNLRRMRKINVSEAVGDIFNDGRLAIYKTNISEPGVLVQGNDLWVPRGGADDLRKPELVALFMGIVRHVAGMGGA